MKNNIGIDEQGRKAISEGLDIYLANLHVLYTKLHNFHWNIEGKSFFQLHAKLEELYDNTAVEIDQVAERILQLGHRPSASIKDYLSKSQLEEAVSKEYSSQEVAHALLDDFSFLAQELRKGVQQAEQYQDQVTADMAVGFLAKLEKAIWMLNAFTS